jgi:uncharacterized protein (TIGR03083 family)
MALSTFEQIAAITEHSAGFATTVRRDLGASVEHCPGWTVADLTWHLADVHWFWGTIVAERLQAPPEESRRPARVPDDQLVDTFVAAAAALVQALREADQTDPCWTWAVGRHDVAFVTRHQVQEAAVHHWDAVHAAGGSWSVLPEVAADAVDEFLHVSVASDDWPDEWLGSGDPSAAGATDGTGRRPLGTLRLHATDAGRSWTLTDGSRPGTARVIGDDGDDVPVLEGSAAELMLWLYARIELDTSALPADLVQRFRALCFSD